ncbi:unnamed protein product [Gordionus sp. m RMFG-2023]|uniref:inositol polyphosphate multikinase-like n=1 Tax=Gordionus sp. m RMFG-2023 TaxID=3053472 RepID=UPI0030E4850D
MDHINNLILNNEDCDKSQKEKVIPPYPPNTSPLLHQVAGHFHGKGKTGLGLLKHDQGPVLKPFQTSSRGENENHFYATVFDDKSHHDEIILSLRRFIPRYFGVEKIEIDRMTVNFIKLEDITTNYEKPCILDIKIGKESYEPGAPSHKVCYEKSKYPLLECIGIRILGMRVYNYKTKTYEFYDKEYGKSLTEDQIMQCLEKYVSSVDNNPDIKTQLIHGFLSQLVDVKDWFSRQNKFRFYASSLLFVYDSHECYSNGTLDIVNRNGDYHSSPQHNLTSYNPNIKSKNIKCDIKMIDFTHVTSMHHDFLDQKNNLQSQFRDDNYLFGLNYLLKIFENLLIL